MDAPDGKPLGSICIGESGRGRSKGIIPLVGGGSEVRVKKTEKNGIVLVRGEWPGEERCLVVINPVGEYDRDRSYSIHASQGLEIISSGTIAFGDAGQINGGDEVLAIVQPGASFKLNSKYNSTWYRWIGTEWILESPEQRKARLALEIVNQGGGEWL